MCYSVMVKQDLKFLADRFAATVVRSDFDDWQLRHQADPKKYKAMTERIYPNYWAPVMVARQNQRVMTPMRYRVFPSWSAQEIPSKYNVFNARLDALETRRTWKSLFGLRHGILVYERFYEWVTIEGKKQVISFSPQGRDLMWSPILWDEWGAERLRSFAIITMDPPPEVAAAGHDRCPIFLREDQIDAWLHPEGRSKKELYDILAKLEPTRFVWKAAA